MHGVRLVGWVAIAISLYAPSAGAGASRMVELAQNVDPGPGEASQPPALAASAALPANTSEQIRKAQTELRRLDCLKGRVDGKLGDQTRQALKTFWASAKQPAGEITITDQVISDLAERGDGFCRPPRPFFAIGARRGGNPALPPFFAPGARPTPVPVPAAPPPHPDAAQ
jgi:peptidoglycan hydrolase-like protein with peptidoglycan-binding domain